MRNNSEESIRAKIIKASGGKIKGADLDALKKGNVNAVGNLLSAEEKKTLLRLMNDKQAAKKILEHPAIKDILNGKR